jgi:hypothetical protein
VCSWDDPRGHYARKVPVERAEAGRPSATSRVASPRRVHATRLFSAQRAVPNLESRTPSRVLTARRAVSTTMPLPSSGAPHQPTPAHRNLGATACARNA